MSWAQCDKTLQETHIHGQKENHYYSDPGGTLEKLNNLKRYFNSCNEEINILKEVKENDALASEGKSH